MIDIKAKAEAEIADTAARTPTTPVRMWFNAAVLSWVAFAVLMLATGPSEKLIASNLIPFGIVSGGLLVLSVYVSQGLARGRRLGGAAGILSFLAFSMALGFAMSFTGVQHYAAWVIRTCLGIVFVVAIRALWAVYASYQRAAGTSPEP